MGGLGSGAWYRWHGRKSTVEESLPLAIGEFRGRIHPYSSGTFNWTWSTGKRSSIGYYVAWTNDGPRLTLHYVWNDAENIEIPVHLQSTPVYFGGERWWFTCPLIVNGAACRRRVGKLYLPGGAKYFGCRSCHGLTYRSCQEAHSEERAAKFFAAHGSKLDAMLTRLTGG